MKAALVQYNPKYLAVDDNLAYVDEMIDGIDADLVVLPELFATGYFFQSVEDLERVAEPVPEGTTCDALGDWARRSGAIIVAGLPERNGDAFFNSAIVVSPEGIVGTYRKIHLFYKEKTLFTGGDLGFPVVDLSTRDGQPYRLGVMICFDWYFPESARALSLKGADIIAHPSNLVRKDCPRAMPIRALENHVFTITANRYGVEASSGEELRFIGQSIICGPDGETLFSAGREEDAVATLEFDPHRARNRQITELNHLFEDRRPDDYRTLTTSKLN